MEAKVLFVHVQLLFFSFAFILTSNLLLTVCYADADSFNAFADSLGLGRTQDFVDRKMLKTDTKA